MMIVITFAKEKLLDKCREDANRWSSTGITDPAKEFIKESEKRYEEAVEKFGEQVIDMIDDIKTKDENIRRLKFRTNLFCVFLELQIVQNEHNFVSGVSCVIFYVLTSMLLVIIFIFFFFAFRVISLLNKSHSSIHIAKRSQKIFFVCLFV